MISHETDANVQPAGPHAAWPLGGRTATVLGLVRRLAQAMRQRGIAYVHWKSNIHLDRALRGEDDLDLLVDRRHACAALDVLSQLHFHEAVGGAARRIAGIRHFFALDRESGQVVHVHLHFQLVLGHDATKNFHLPLERAVLSDVRQDHDLPIPAPEFELILYTIRMVLKFSLFPNPLARYDRSGHHDELDFLQRAARRHTVERILDTHLPWVGRPLFDACLACLRPRTSNRFRWRTRARLHRALATFARRPALLDGWLKRARLWSAGLRRLTCRPKAQKHWVNGGLIIAVVGGDGAGKSTLIAHLQDHYRTIVATRRIHIGRPTPAWTTLFVRLLILGQRICRRRSPADAPGPSPESTADRGLLVALRYVCLARDRCRAYVRARRWATGGMMVICDRWPVTGLRRMEAAQLDEFQWAERGSRLRGLLQRMEGHYYGRIPAPDKLVVLRLHPSIAVARKPAEPSQWLRARSQEIWDFDWSGTEAHVVDASQPLPDVVSQAVAQAWQALGSGP